MQSEIFISRAKKNHCELYKSGAKVRGWVSTFEISYTASRRVASLKRPAKAKATEELLEENNQCGVYEMCS